jgi:hypothetical protein
MINYLKVSFKIFFLLLSFFLSVSNTFAQKPKIQNLPKFDQKIIHFGFMLGINSTDFSVNKKPDFGGVDSMRVIESQSQPGFNLGIVSELHFNQFWSIRFVPTLAFAQRDLEYTLIRFDTVRSKFVNPVESTFLEFPVLLKYRSKRANNFGAYIVGGGKYVLDMASQKDVSNEFGENINIRLYKHDYAFELGVGFDFFLEYFKFSPEIKLSFGLRDILIQDNNIYTTPIQRLTSRILLISLNFEG